MTSIAHRELNAIWIELDDVDEYDDELAQAIANNARRYENLISDLIYDMLPTFKTKEVPPKDSLDVYIEHRLLMEARMRPNQEHRDHRNQYPKELLKRFEVYFKDLTVNKTIPIRDVKADYIGKLVTVKGVVTRTTEVKPMMQVATYTCDKCGSETYQPIRSLSFMPVFMCPSDDCRVNKAGGRVYLQTRGSKFIKFQEIRIQEHVSLTFIIFTIIYIGRLPNTRLLLGNSKDRNNNFKICSVFRF